MTDTFLTVDHVLFSTHSLRVACGIASIVGGYLVLVRLVAGFCASNNKVPRPPLFSGPPPTVKRVPKLYDWNEEDAA